MVLFEMVFFELQKEKHFFSYVKNKNVDSMVNGAF